MATDADPSRAVPVPESLSAQANALLLQTIRKLPGVVYVEPFGGEAIGEQSFRVYVRDGDPDAERAVYKAKGSVYDCYPEAALDVEVLEQSDLPLGNPPQGPETR